MKITSNLLLTAAILSASAPLLISQRADPRAQQNGSVSTPGAQANASTAV